MAKKVKNSSEEGLVVKSKKGKNGETPPSALAKTKYDYILKNKKSRNETKNKKMVTILAIVLILLLVGVGAFYGMYTAIKLNSFKVFVDSPGKKVLSLSSDQEFSFGTETLEIDGPNTMDNTTLPAEFNKSNSTSIEERLELIITSENFEYKPSDSFIAASFFLKNTTGEDQSYSEQLTLRSATNNVDTAMRVMLIRNYNIMVYARAKDGEKEKVVPLIKNVYTPLHILENPDGTIIIEHTGTDAWIADDFYSDEQVFSNEALTIKAGEIVRYSIIIWLEGWDSDCVDDKLNGIIQMDFAFMQEIIA